jgi:hypothetical protein
VDTFLSVLDAMGVQYASLVQVSVHGTDGSVSSRAIWAALDDKLSGCLRGLHDAERNSGCFGEAGATGGCRNGLAVTTTTTEQITEFAILSAEAPG